MQKFIARFQKTRPLPQRLLAPCFSFGGFEIPFYRTFPRGSLCFKSVYDYVKIQSIIHTIFRNVC